MIRYENVYKSYNGESALVNFNMDIKKGELVVLLGKSGCGKSTVLKLLNKLVNVDGGNIYINNDNINNYNIQDLRKNIGYVVQNIGLFPNMTVFDNVGISLKLLKWNSEDIDERVQYLLDLVGLDKEFYKYKYPYELSGGEAQRVGVARALAAKPDILILDEPFGALDPITRYNLQNEFLKIQEELNITAIFVTHDMDEAFKMGDRIGIMNNGKLVIYDETKNILSSKNKYVTAFMGDDIYLKSLSKYFVRDILISDIDLSLDFSIDIDRNLKDCLNLMIKYSVTKLRVVENSKVVGYIDISSLLKILD